MKPRTPIASSRHAFSLVELLVVIAIIGIIGAFAVPAAGQLLKGSSMTQAANTFTDQTAAARQYALTRNRPVEVRFFKYTNPEEVGGLEKFRALQWFEVAEGGILNPVGKLIRLPDTIMMSENVIFSSILGNTDPKGPQLVTNPGAQDPELPRGVGKKYKYMAFRFLPDGTTSLPPPPNGGPAGGKWFITCHLTNDLNNPALASGNKPPANFFTWQIDPISGATKILRPGVVAAK